MKLVSFIILITCLQITGNVFGQQDRRISIKADSLPLTRLLKMIEKKSGYRFVYRNDLIPAGKKVSVNETNASTEDILKKILKNTGLTFKQLSATLVAIAPENKEIRNISINGTVTDVFGHPLPGVSLRIAGLNKGTTTDENGTFHMEAPSSATLICSFIGYEEQRVTVNNTAPLNIMLKDDSKGLNEVVVVAYGVQTKSSLTGSATMVSASLYDKAPRSSFQESLQGNVPGLQSTNGSGQPGSIPSIHIRGIGSITAGSSPLYVVDGTPVVTDNLTDYNVNSLAGINSADIASISVLKDAASASIYGSRAANGVILITTKTGSLGRTKISATVQRGSNQLTIPQANYPLNTKEMMELLREGWAHKADGTGEAGFQRELRARGVDTTVNTNWIDVLTRHGSYTQANLSAAGGSNKTKFYVSGGLYDSKSALKGVDYKRMTGKLNLSNQATNRLSFDVNLSLSYQRANAVGDVGLMANPVRSLVRLQPWLKIYNADGSYDFSYNNTFNPVAVLNGDTRTGTIYGLLGGAGAKYAFTDFLSFETKISLDLNYARSNSFFAPGFGDGRNTNGWVSVNNSLWNNWVSTNILRFNRRWGYHGINTFVGYEAQKTTNSGNASAASNLLPDLQLLADASKPESVSSVSSANSLTGLFLNNSYDYKQKYYLTASIRRDASSRFGRQKRSAAFWSIGTAWNIYREPFLQNVNVINELKIRASYGSNGNQAIDNYASLSLYSPANDYDGKPGYVLTQYPNPFLTWEQNRPFNIGLDFALLKNRLSGTVEYYNRTTSRLLLNVPVSSANGITTVFRNNGEMKNSGWEISLSSRNIIAKNENEFSWRTDANISTLNNKITRLDNPITSVPYKREVGTDFYQFFLVGFAGADPKTGEALWYKDASKTTTTNSYGEAQRFNQGSALPKFYGGVTNYFSYKGFDLSFQFFYNWGNKVYDNWGTFTESDGSGGFGGGAKMSRLIYENRWQKPGDITNVPKVVFGGTQSGLSNQSSSRFLYDGSFIRLRDVMLAYNLQQNWLRKANINEVKIYVRGNNLWTYVKDKYLTMDPEVPVTGDYDQRPPVFKTFLVGLDVNF
ncbi:TonB-linked outer membrane protein, SusC/RagA family [Chitinophaga ginsengisegetis]|uniref:TonB-linked outer membrane protein, SusC/RagA family n=1 Tax=Chitinophaga ginsengisegetis TaxID=393003 RepID=A0A1T5P7Q8_9BACT|nr:SusC/RagA family TonB-linked outer membrane protein [Chitinophaga ginsengisegetis]SKD08794.1 TonB-linked outer membrane protein, SusC/RagA family [Chitinophaga ginsengisegetis]